MIIKNVISGKEKIIRTFAQLESLLNGYENLNDFYELIRKAFERGDNLYYCQNPYVAEINNCTEIIIGKNESQVREKFYSLQEEI